MEPTDKRTKLSGRGRRLCEVFHHPRRALAFKHEAMLLYPTNTTGSSGLPAAGSTWTPAARFCFNWRSLLRTREAKTTAELSLLPRCSCCPTPTAPRADPGHGGFSAQETNQKTSRAPTASSTLTGKTQLQSNPRDTKTCLDSKEKQTWISWLRYMFYKHVLMSWEQTRSHQLM